MDSLTGKRRTLIGMVHVGALPGTPHARLPVALLARQAVHEARVLEQTGYDAVMLENMHDRPYLHRGVGPEIVGAMAVIASTVAASVSIPCGIQILAAANREALAVAHVSGLRFLRAEAFTYAHVADEGIIEASAGELLRYRRLLAADSVLIMADIRKKHASHAITGDVTIGECARTVEFCCGDAVVVTGAHTGDAADATELAAVRAATSLPVVVGSGASPDVLARYRDADAVIVGSWIKENGDWRRPVAPERARALADAFRAISGTGSA